MPFQDDAVSALARAYALTELLPLESDRVQGEMEAASRSLTEDLALRVAGGRIQVEDAVVGDPDGCVFELARDLERMGVVRLHLPGELARDDLTLLVRSLREKTGEDGAESWSRQHAETLSEIGVAFAGEHWPTSGPGLGVEAVFSEETSSTFDLPVASDEPTPSESGPTLDEAVRRLLDCEPSERTEASVSVREAAARAEESGGHDHLAAALVRLALRGATSSDLESRSEALASECRRLARDLLSPAAARSITRRLAGAREGEREGLLRSLPVLGAGMAGPLAEALAEADDRGARRNYVGAMVALGEEARPEVERMLEDRQWFVARNGADILGEVGTEGDVQHLTAPLAHGDPRVRKETVFALAKIGGEDAGMLLLGMLDDSDPDVRAAVAAAIGALKLERGVKLLLQRLEIEDSEEVQVQLLRSLGALGDPGTVPAIEKRAVPGFFSRPPTAVRVAAYRALGGIHTPHAMEVVEAAREDKDPEVRDAVSRILH